MNTQNSGLIQKRSIYLRIARNLGFMEEDSQDIASESFVVDMIRKENGSKYRCDFYIVIDAIRRLYGRDENSKFSHEFQMELTENIQFQAKFYSTIYCI